MKNKTKNIIGLFLLIPFFYMFIMLQYLTYKHTKMLEEDSKPFMEACNSPNGCILEPEGWKLETENNYSCSNNEKSPNTPETINKQYYKDMMNYTATKDEFTIIKHIATDTYLIVNGGKNKTLTIEKVMDGEIDWDTYKIIR